jgi:small subunit ribosomal protein S20
MLKESFVAHSLSAKKRVRQNAKHRLANRRRKEGLKDTLREFQTALSSGDKAAAGKALNAAYKKIDQVTAKGTMHRKTAARRKSSLARALNAGAAK